MSKIVRSPLEGSGGNIRVCIRVRPPNQREMALAGGVIVSVPEDQPGQVVVEGKPAFQLDVTFPTTVTQLKCFQDVGVNIVQTACQGFNGKPCALLFFHSCLSSCSVRVKHSLEASVATPPLAPVKFACPARTHLKCEEWLTGRPKKGIHHSYLPRT